jgi:hypothetical protein
MGAQRIMVEREVQNAQIASEVLSEIAYVALQVVDFNL